MTLKVLFQLTFWRKHLSLDEVPYLVGTLQL